MLSTSCWPLGPWVLFSCTLCVVITCVPSAERTKDYYCSSTTLRKTVGDSVRRLGNFWPDSKVQLLRTVNIATNHQGSSNTRRNYGTTFENSFCRVVEPKKMLHRQLKVVVEPLEGYGSTAPYFPSELPTDFLALGQGSINIPP